MEDKVIKVILVCDDDEDIRLMLSYVLEDAGYKVMTASNGEEALTCLEQDTPSVILLDLMMPKMNGMELIEELGKRGMLSRSRILIMTAFSKMEKNVQQAPVDGFIAKPFVYIEWLLDQIARHA